MTTDTQWTDWIPHDGGPCPCPWAEEGELQVRFADGIEERGAYSARFWTEGGADFWRHEDEDPSCAITAYRVRSNLAHRLAPAEPAGAPGSPAVRPVAEAAEEMAREPVMRALHALECADAADDYRRQGWPVPENWADPWQPSGARQLAALSRRAETFLAAYRAATEQGG